MEVPFIRDDGTQPLINVRTQRTGTKSRGYDDEMPGSGEPIEILSPIANLLSAWAL